MTEQPTCVPGCVRFYGGEKRHHPSCPFYAESLTKFNADRIAALEAENERLRKGLEELLDRATASRKHLDPDWIPAFYRARAALQENDNG